MTVLYKCDKCKRIYETPDEAVQCELECSGWGKEVAHIIGLALDPCDYCKHAYYVYGCEFDCEYYRKKECGGEFVKTVDQYPKFERKVKDE